MHFKNRIIKSGAEIIMDNKSSIKDIIYGEKNYRESNYFENISYSFTQLQIASINKLKVSYLCFELTGEMLLEFRRLKAFHIELRHIYVYRYNEKSPYFDALRELGGGICLPISELVLNYNKDDILLNSWDYSVKVVDLKTFLYKVNRFFNRKWPNKIKRHNPISNVYDEKTVDCGFWRNVREMDIERMLYYQNHVKDLELTYDMLEDNASKETFIEIIRSVCMMDRWRYTEGRPDLKYWEYYQHLDDECWVNCGACYGDSILWYAMNGYPFKEIDAYEGDINSAKVLTETIKKAGLLVNIYNQYIGVGESTKGNFDELYAKRRVTLINMDIEGAEINVLTGAKKIIVEQRPVLAICAYHRAADLIELPRLIKETVDDYAIFLKKYSAASADPINEFVYYFVPRERTLNFCNEMSKNMADRVI